MYAALRRVWDWTDDHMTKLLAAAGLNLIVGDVTGFAEPIKALAGDLGYKLVLGAAFAALIWRGVVTGKRGAALVAQLNKPPDIP